MPRLSIDQRSVEVPAGATVLDAARQLGIEIPTLCFLRGHPPNTSCMLCMVKVAGRWLPSCATPAEEGMAVESETEEVRQLRRTGLELLLSHHQGDCSAPCEHACPLHLDIPLMLSQVADGDLIGAIATIRAEMALPSIMGRVCGDLCEKACRRKDADSPAAICLVKQFVTDADLASDHPYLPPRLSATGQRVAILGTGPAALSAAYHLQLAGHACTLLDSRAEAGGVLRYEMGEEQLPRTLLDREIGLIERLGARLMMSCAALTGERLQELRTGYDAVLLVDWPLSPMEAESGGYAGRAARAQHELETHQTHLPGMFVAGELLRPGQPPARLLADGKRAALCIDQYLLRGAVTGSPSAFHVRAGRVPREEIVALTVRAGVAARVQPVDNAATAISFDQARTEASRCLHCDCGKHDGCRLRRYAAMLGAQPGHYRGERRPIERSDPHGEVIYEPGKCILCGICIQIATEAREPLGLTFIGRGFDVKVAAPGDRAISAGLTRVAAACIDACPTGALSKRGRESFTAPS